MSKPKLSYFDFPGSRGEECRLALVLAGVDFEDDRIPRMQWPERRQGMPFKRVPVLSVDGRQLGECNAILRFVAEEHDLLPQGRWERAQHDSFMEAAEDVRARIARVLHGDLPEEEKVQARKELARGPVQEWAQAMEAQIVGPFLFGASPTVADIKLAMIRNWLISGVIDHFPREALDDYPKLERLHQELFRIPEIAAFRAKFA